MTVYKIFDVQDCIYDFKMFYDRTYNISVIYQSTNHKQSFNNVLVTFPCCYMHCCFTFLAIDMFSNLNRTIVSVSNEMKTNLSEKQYLSL